MAVRYPLQEQVTVTPGSCVGAEGVATPRVTSSGADYLARPVQTGSCWSRMEPCVKTVDLSADPPP